MTTNYADHDAQPVWPRPTIRAVRAALPPQYRAAFTAEIEDADLSDLAAVSRIVALWRARAVGYSDPRTAAAMARPATDHPGATPAADILPGWSGE